MNNEDIKWITINHVHIPIKPNQTKEEAFKEFTQKQDKRRELNDMTVDELKTIKDDVTTSVSAHNISKEILDFCNSLSESEVRSTKGYSFFNSRGEDKVLKGIISLQKFDKLPKIVDQEEIKRLVGTGYIGFTRGMRVEDGADAYKSGDMYIGRGVSGSGVYATAFTNDGRYTNETTAMKNAKEYSGIYDQPYTGSILVGALNKDAKIISKSDLERIRNEIMPTLSDNAKGVFSNNGNLAAALGYDAVDCGTKSYIILLNRGKTIVAK